ncbi:MAG: DUF935 family protein [Verrucomicrobiota bacterium]
MNEAPPASPIAAFGTLAAQYRQTRGNLLGTLTASGLTGMRNSFDAGYLRTFALLGDEIYDTDDTAGTVIEKRCGRVARRKWDIIIGEDVPDYLRAQAEAHQEALKFFYSNLRVRNAVELNETGSMQLLMRQMMRAVFQKYYAHEIAWKPSAQGLTAELWSVPLACMESTQGELRFAGLSGSSTGIKLDPQNWLFAVHHRCIMKCLAALNYVKRLAFTDWVNFSEKFGTPGLHLETTATPGSPEWNNAVEGLAAFARNWAMVSSPGQKVNLIEVSSSGEGPFAPLVDLCNRAMARVALGSDLATMSRENGAGASLQGDETDELIADDCGWLDGLLNEQISRRVVENRFGPGTLPLAYLKITPPTKEDTKLEMDVDKHVQSFNVNLSPKDIAERYNRTHVEPEAAPAEAPTAAPVAKPAEVEAPAANDKPVVPAKDQRAALLKRLQDAVKSDLKEAAEALAKIESAEDPAAGLDELDLAELLDSVLDAEDVDAALEDIVAREFLGGFTDRSRDGDSQEGAARKRKKTTPDAAPATSAANEGRDIILAAANEGIPLAHFTVVESEGLFMPYGRYAHSVGVQIVDAESARLLTEEFDSVWSKARRFFAGACIYVGHPDHHDATVRALYQDRRAYGWCKGIETQPDGILFRVKWNGLGKEVIEGGQYAYHSPYWLLTRVTTPDGKAALRPHKLISIGLTNNPNVPVPALIS